MPDFSKCIIYKIQSKDPQITDVYIGSTCSFSQRKANHKQYTNCDYLRQYQYPLYKFIREHGGYDQFEMIPLERYTECKDHMDKSMRERKWYDEYKLTCNMLNSHIPNRSKKQYYKDNATIFNKKSKEYYTNNLQKRREYSNQIYTCECGAKNNLSNKTNHNNTNKHKKKIEALQQNNIIEPPNVQFVDLV